MLEPIQVDGRRLTRDLATFEEDCLRLIDDEIFTFDPDMMLVELLADAVRLAREYADCSQQIRKESGGQGVCPAT